MGKSFRKNEQQAQIFENIKFIRLTIKLIALCVTKAFQLCAGLASSNFTAGSLH